MCYRTFNGNQLNKGKDIALEFQNESEIFIKGINSFDKGAYNCWENERFIPPNHNWKNFRKHQVKWMGKRQSIKLSFLDTLDEESIKLM